jgi:hypothetical protein
LQALPQSAAVEVLEQTLLRQATEAQAVAVWCAAKQGELQRLIRATMAATLLLRGRTSLVLLLTAVAVVLLKKATLTVTLRVATV